MGIANPGLDVPASNKILLEELSALNLDLDVPTLEQFGASKKRFGQVVKTMAEQALASGSPSNNPRVPSIDQMIELYQQLWHTLT